MTTSTDHHTEEGLATLRDQVADAAATLASAYEQARYQYYMAGEYLDWGTERDEWMAQADATCEALSIAYEALTSARQAAEMCVFSGRRASRRVFGD